MDPTATLLPVELSYIDTRQVTGVVPSGNSRGSSAFEKEPERERKEKKLFIQEYNLSQQKCEKQK